MSQHGSSSDVDTGQAGALRSLLAVERRDGAILAVCLDQSGTRLTEVSWRPAESLSLRHVALSRPIDFWPAAASLSADTLLVSQGEERLVMVDRQSGAVRRLPRPPGVAAFLPDGSAVAFAVDHGLLVQTVVRHPDTPPSLVKTQPMLVMEFDSPRDIAVIPDRAPDTFSVAIGCYGRLGLVDVERRSPYLPGASGLMVDTGGLPYDPIRIERPTPVSINGFSRLFITDEGRAGLASVELASGDFLRFPSDINAYAAIRRVVPHLQGEAALVETRDGKVWHWLPGEEPVQIAPATLPLLWLGDHVLVVDPATGALAERPFPG